MDHNTACILQCTGNCKVSILSLCWHTLQYHSVNCGFGGHSLFRTRYTLNEKPEASAAWCGASKFRWLSRYGHNIDIKGQ